MIYLYFFSYKTCSMSHERLVSIIYVDTVLQVSMY